MEAPRPGHQHEEPDAERGGHDPHDCTGCSLRLLAADVDLVGGGGEGVRSAGLGQQAAAEALVPGVGRRVEVWEDARRGNWTGEGVETDVEILKRGAVVEVGWNGSGEGIVREINVGDGRESGDFPGNDSGERVSTQIE